MKILLAGISNFYGLFGSADSMFAIFFLVLAQKTIRVPQSGKRDRCTAIFRKDLQARDINCPTSASNMAAAARMETSWATGMESPMMPQVSRQSHTNQCIRDDESVSCERAHPTINVEPAVAFRREHRNRCDRGNSSD